METPIDDTPSGPGFGAGVNRSVEVRRLAGEPVADRGFRAELDAWLRDGVRAWFAGHILDADESVLVTWRQLVTEGQQSHYSYAQPDALIVATAMVHGLAVVTRNAEDFVRAGVHLFNPWQTA